MNDNNDNTEEKNWLKKHADTIATIVVIVAATYWMSSAIGELKKDIAVIKTVLILRNIMPQDLAYKERA
jgi:hypothetical protein